MRCATGWSDATGTLMKKKVSGYAGGKNYGGRRFQQLYRQNLPDLMPIWKPLAAGNAGFIRSLDYRRMFGRGQPAAYQLLY